MQQPTTTDQLEPSRPSATAVDYSLPLSWLTVERAAYLGLALLALILRLMNLGVVPLSDAEAGQALVGWHIYQDQPVDQVGYSPLIATLNLVSFVLLGHWIVDERFKTPIEQFVNHEVKGMEHYIAELHEHSPFKNT